MSMFDTYLEVPDDADDWEHKDQLDDSWRNADFEARVAELLNWLEREHRVELCRDMGDHLVPIYDQYKVLVKLFIDSCICENQQERDCPIHGEAK